MALTPRNSLGIDSENLDDIYSGCLLNAQTRYSGLSGTKTGNNILTNYIFNAKKTNDKIITGQLIAFEKKNRVLAIQNA